MNDTNHLIEIANNICDETYATEQERDNELHQAEVLFLKNKMKCKTKSKQQSYGVAINAVHKARAYKLTNMDTETNTGLCVCGRITDIIDEPFYCKYCGQRLSAKWGWSINDYYNEKKNNSH